LPTFHGATCNIANKFVTVVQYFNFFITNSTEIETFKQNYGSELAHILNITQDHIHFLYVGIPRIKSNSISKPTFVIQTASGSATMEVDFEIIAFEGDNFTATTKYLQLQTQLNDQNSTFYSTSFYAKNIVSTAQECDNGDVQLFCSLTSLPSSSVNTLGMWIGISLSILFVIVAVIVFLIWRRRSRLRVQNATLFSSPIAVSV
jgi:hypothetical protein